jgi:spermidine synthase
VNEAPASSVVTPENSSAVQRPEHGDGTGSPSRRPFLFLLFFLSGASGLICQVVWARMAFAAFGVITPVLSVVLSVFMLGLSLGAWAGGRKVDALRAKSGWSAIVFYGFAEFGIGLGAYAVPPLFQLGRHALLAVGQTNSLVYLVLSALVLAVTILPWCVCMGATFPLMMAYVREVAPEGRGAGENHAEMDAAVANGPSTGGTPVPLTRADTSAAQYSFSYLYAANVLGALAGTLMSAFVLIEVVGLRDTLHLAAFGNFFAAAIAWLLGRGTVGVRSAAAMETAVGESPAPAAASSAPESLTTQTAKWILFTTGFVSMAMEVVWVRAFAPVLKTQVYSFALVVAAYLGATFHGAQLYRRHLRLGRTRPTGTLLGLLSVTALLPVFLNSIVFVGRAWGNLTPDLRFMLPLLASIYPFCALLGYLTSSLMDRCAAGLPDRAGRAYAVNVLGCILGPLFAGYVLLPWLSERYGLVLLSLPLAGFYVALGRTLTGKRRLVLDFATAATVAAALFFPLSYEDLLLKHAVHPEVRRSCAATVISTGAGRGRSLLVNGYGMTSLTSGTKIMAHLTLGLHKGPPKSALIVCFGMGTTYRSALSWGIRTTAVELVPGVRDAFGFYHDDAAEVLRNPQGRIVIDDGRRYLQRDSDAYDAIVIDPPPPVETAGSSLLYSREFYEVAKRRLNRGGIVQAWVPESSPAVFAAALGTLCDAFPYVRCFPSIEGSGLHMLASMQPIEVCTPAEFLARLPSAARQDAVEWCPEEALKDYLNVALTKQKPGQELVPPDFKPRIMDDRPFNEYFLVRRIVFGY